MTDEEYAVERAKERASRERNRGYFVMLRHQNGRPILMTASLEDSDAGTSGWDAAVFATRKEALEAGKRNPLGKACGFKVFKWDQW